MNEESAAPIDHSQQPALSRDSVIVARDVFLARKFQLERELRELNGPINDFSALLQPPPPPHA